MISVHEAQALILKHSKSGSSKRVKLSESIGCVLSKDIKSAVHMPPFDQSAMDGYAFKFKDFTTQKNIAIVGEVPAGKPFYEKLKSGQCVRIFTGAPIPKDLDTVVMQEKVTVKNNMLYIQDTALKLGANVRKMGTQTKKGSLALRKGEPITPGGIGYLASLGMTHVDVFSKPKISIIVTGSELKKIGQKLKPGEIYESNSHTLIAALTSVGFDVDRVVHVQDHQTKTRRTIQDHIKRSNMVLITGGISVGDYDFVGTSLNTLGVKNIFYKIKQKPGKPIFFGTSNATLVFGLPGNPAAVLSCFYEYVYPALRCMQGLHDPFLKRYKLPILKNYPKKQGLSFFLKAKICKDGVMPLEGQESFILSSFSTADALIFLPEEAEQIQQHDLVEVHELPGLY